jgi:hypothetical protein
MRTILGTIVLATLTLAISNGPSEAQTYPWCVIYNSEMGIRNCGFSTLEQCRMTASGEPGSICEPNPWYEPAIQQPRSRRR